MKYLSEKTNKSYDTIEELEVAEKEYDLELAEKEKKSNERKKAAEEVNAAYEHLHEVRIEADKIRKEAEDRASTMIREAKECAKAKLEQFNTKYGTFYVSVNPRSEITSIFDDLFRGFWF